jgi:hypothetical protein
MTEADRELRRRLAELDRCWYDRSQAENAGLRRVAEEAHREIQRLYVLIRKHCHEHGLPLPSSVPKGE